MVRLSQSRLFHAPRKASLSVNQSSTLQSSQKVDFLSSSLPVLDGSKLTQSRNKVFKPTQPIQTRNMLYSYKRSCFDQLHLSYASHQSQRYVQGPDRCRELYVLLNYVEEAFCRDDDIQIGDLNVLLDELIEVVEHTQSQLEDDLIDAVTQLIKTLEAMRLAEQNVVGHVKELWSMLGGQVDYDELGDEGIFGSPSYHQLDDEEAQKLTHSISFELQIITQIHTAAQAPRSSGKVMQLLAQ